LTPLALIVPVSWVGWQIADPIERIPLIHSNRASLSHQAQALGGPLLIGKTAGIGLLGNVVSAGLT